jgi:hypothetical protein
MSVTLALLIGLRSVEGTEAAGNVDDLWRIGTRGRNHSQRALADYGFPCDSNWYADHDPDYMAHDYSQAHVSVKNGVYCRREFLSF